MNKHQNILVIAPHADDEVFGVGGYIRKMVDRGCVADLCIVALGGVKHYHHTTEVTTSSRIAELDQSSDILGFSTKDILFEGKDMIMDTVPQKDIITKLDAILDKKRYDQVLLPFASYNRDHQLVFNAGWAALRIKPDRDPISFIALYEYPYQSWTYEPIRGGKLYIDISDEIKLKEKALRCYKSQLRKYPSPCSVAGMRNLASSRGMEAGVKYAELLYVQKQIIR